ncbi:MAG: 30S ribosomal protein S20 [Verrucomicrobiales bacterium]|nr:30S ribosomal protein S20 [Verrucomicrobiales bacterium]MCP5526449.1 30S ribosomal protein S20 [Verrucomicrobiales bacterium]
MPNTLSAERRVRSNARRQLRNRSEKSRVKTLEKTYLNLASSGDREKATSALRDVTSALDKAAKRGVIHWATVNRKKSRLAVKLPAAA